MGPIYPMHALYTVAMLLLLVWWIAYRRHPETTKRISQSLLKALTGEMPSVSITPVAQEPLSASPEATS